MFTYDVVSESVRNPHELARELTRRSQAGWEVVQVVHDGEHWIHAFIRHAGAVATAPYPTASVSAGAPAEAQTPQAAPQAAQPSAQPSVQSLWQTATGTPGDGNGYAAATPQQSQPTQPVQGGAVPSVPANWYKDPSGRFEMRYWNGSAWTEHVATAGKQSIDPPKK